MSEIMDDLIVIRTTVPILLLIGIGLVSRNREYLKSGDERVLSAYVYYFALPALFFVNLAEITFTEETIRFVVAGLIPLLAVLLVYLLIYPLIKFPKNTLYLLIVSTVFGSLAFFGIPYITFAFPTMQAAHLATLSAASISIIGVTASIIVLELYKLQKTTIWRGFKQVLRKLSRNPLIISILFGVLVSLSGVEIPGPVSTFLHMLGGTTSTVAIFMLGVFLYGRKYENIGLAIKLSLLRIVFLPVIAFLVNFLFQLPSLEMSILVLMHGMPIAISLTILSERYDFYKETIATLSLVSSLSAGIYLNLWLLLLAQY